jgi:hypothetical protein
MSVDETAWEGASQPCPPLELLMEEDAAGRR